MFVAVRKYKSTSDELREDIEWLLRQVEELKPRIREQRFVIERGSELRLRPNSPPTTADAALTRGSRHRIRRKEPRR
jgi:hypothetical protein